MSKKVAVIMGSDSDLPVVKGALEELDKFGIPYEVHVMSAHRRWQQNLRPMPRKTALA